MEIDYLVKVSTYTTNKTRGRVKSQTRPLFICTPDGVRFQIFNSQKGKIPFGSSSFIGIYKLWFRRWDFSWTVSSIILEDFLHLR